ncbi:MarR family transcriptional regulator [Kutzneria viridogrisea]|uniref:HTH marR-type domain-containing protein n=2 Tax=Kutzneria TaxID=43356 RepID=W5WQ00_9PSEU|nr:MarR family transcriptional regulator [Kutzneria albida]AHI00245.1 hypothetical protein KALB_6886 [Kutzneria albida DSM 43870]MBA8925421.1 DNA-binding MarR family transcriptional regulator [Kutzneria viridogrisea]
MVNREALLAWLYLQQGVDAVQDAVGRDLERVAGCTLHEHVTLYRLKVAPEQRLTMAELAELLAVSPSGVTRLVDRLVRRGWITRYQPPDNRRTVYAVLAEPGLKVLREHSQREYRRSVAEHFTSTLDEGDVEHLARIGRKLLESHGRWDAKRFATPPG